jgi:hypothetical protein
MFHRNLLVPSLESKGSNGRKDASESIRVDASMHACVWHFYRSVAEVDCLEMKLQVNIVDRFHFTVIDMIKS